MRYAARLAAMPICVMITLLFSLALPLAAQPTPEDLAEKTVNRLRGKVIRDEKAPGKPVIRVAPQLGPFSELRDEDLKELAAFKHLQELDLTGS